MSQALELLEKNQKIENIELLGLVKTNLVTLNEILDNNGVADTDEMNEMMMTLLRNNVTIFFEVVDKCQPQKQELTKGEIIELLTNRFDENDPDNVRDMNINQWLQENNIAVKKQDDK